MKKETKNTAMVVVVGFSGENKITITGVDDSPASFTFFLGPMLLAISVLSLVVVVSGVSG